MNIVNTSIKPDLICYLITVTLCLFSCTEKQQKIKKQGHEIYVKAAALTGMNQTQFFENFVMLDSTKVQSIGLSLFYFKDRNYVPDNPQKSLVYVIDSANHAYLFSHKAAGFYPISIQQLKVIDSGYITSELHWLHISNTSLELKTEALLNELPIRVKNKLNRQNLDSLFRYVIVNQLDKRNALSEKKYRLNEWPQSDNTFAEIKKIWGDTNGTLVTPMRYYNKFKAFVESNIGKENFFVYTHEYLDKMIVVTINEQFANLTNQEKYINTFTVDDKFYDINIYNYP